MHFHSVMMYLCYADRVVIPTSLRKWMKTWVKSCKGCSLAVKSPLIKFQPWAVRDIPWSHLHLDFAGLLNRAYYLVVVDSYTKWPEIRKC